MSGRYQTMFYLSRLFHYSHTHVKSRARDNVSYRVRYKTIFNAYLLLCMLFSNHKLLHNLFKQLRFSAYLTTQNLYTRRTTIKVFNCFCLQVRIWTTRNKLFRFCGLINTHSLILELYNLLELRFLSALKVAQITTINLRK